MCQRHRNQIVPVYRPWVGAGDRVSYFTTKEKAQRMVETHRAILCDSEKGVLGGIERVASSGNLKDPARTESHSVREAFVKYAGDPETTSAFELAQHFRSLSPYRWAQSGGRHS
jgi:hypothetical protein